VQTTSGKWITPPADAFARNGHSLGPNQVPRRAHRLPRPRAVGTPRGRAAHAIRRCAGPPLNTHCSALDGPATVRISTARKLTAKTPGRDARPIREKGPTSPESVPRPLGSGIITRWLVDVPVQYFQSIITVLLAVAGALLFSGSVLRTDPQRAHERGRSVSPARHDGGDHRDAIRLP